MLLDIGQGPIGQRLRNALHTVCVLVCPLWFDGPAEVGSIRVSDTDFPKAWHAEAQPLQHHHTHADVIHKEGNIKAR